MRKKKYKIVIDTNVFISALKSRKGASFKLLFDVPRRKYEQNISSTLIFEYESVAKRESGNISMSDSQIDAILDMICKISTKCEIFFLWRPYLKDPKDDFILELAIESHSEIIVTYNKDDFIGVDKFGIKVLTPKEFLKKIGEI
ncbi:MAG: putative toxin-antitoxin system toxin component, PIN family [Calditrichaceae bacterium]|nr:putative toxin-antitoxin system toxin component, PIN family [Calditrichaceae bacterium]MBN2710018.1 putative toxin-antitoxin system toxin component, PIN family [Calditrichaceae bacterium]RQV93678.1 MAG: putative toxin-antitoxin system toxin component, PIN family [Calditrichota bacterium]